MKNNGSSARKKFCSLSLLIDGLKRMLMKIRINIKVYVFVFALLAAGCSEKRCGEHLDALNAQWLPSSSRNISFIEQNGFLIFECTTSEDIVRKYYADKNQNLLEISDPISAIAYKYKTAKGTISHEYFIDMPVRDGVYFRKQFGNGGQILIVYDRSCKKLYYFQQPR